MTPADRDDLVDLLDDLHEYLDQRADASQDGPGSLTPNRPMVLLCRVETGLNILRKGEGR